MVCIGISESYLDEQRKLHRNPRYGVASIEFAPLVASLLRIGRCGRLTDYGAGKCNLLYALGSYAEGVAYQPFDPVFPEYGPARPADLVTCIDVLEHVEPDRLDAVLAELASITDRLALFTVHTGPAKKVLSDGRNAHLTQQPEQWWLEQFESRFDVLHLKRIPKGFFVLVTRRGATTQLSEEMDFEAIKAVAAEARPRSFWGKIRRRLVATIASRTAEGA